MQNLNKTIQEARMEDKKMLKISKDKDFIKVTEILPGWSDTSVKTVLYDLVNKKK